MRVVNLQNNKGTESLGWCQRTKRVKNHGADIGRWGGQRGMGWAESGGRAEGAIVLKEREGVIGLRERSDRLAASVASRAVQDRAPRSEAQQSAVQTARNR